MAQTAAVDQVLGAVAEVVKDRAKSVATRTVVRRLKSELCDRTITLTPYQPPQSGSASSPASAPAAADARADDQWALAPAPPPGVAAPADVPAFGEPTPSSQLELYLGGRPACRDDQTRCEPNDVFLRFCRLTRNLDVPLTDAYLLKSVSQDTVDFLVRVAARNLSEQRFREAGLDQVGAFIHAILEQAGRPHPRPGDLADPTLALADRLSAGLPSRSIDTLRGSPSLGALSEAVDQVTGEWIRAGCPVTRAGAGGTALACEKAPVGAWVVGQCESREAGQFRGAEARRHRKALFDRVFQAKSATGEEGWLAAGRDRPCGEAFAGDAQAAQRRSCGLARLTTNLGDALLKVRCKEVTADPDAVRALLRELGYVLAEQETYQAIIEDLRKDSTLAAVAKDRPGLLEAFVRDASQLDLAALPREQLAYGFRVLGTYLAAADIAPDATAAWLGQLARDMAGLDFTKEEEYRAFLHGPALGTDQRPTAPAVAALRSAVKDFVTLPSLALGQHRELVQASRTARQSLQHLLEEIARTSSPRTLDADLLIAVGDFVEALADVVTAAADALASRDVVTAALDQRAAAPAVRAKLVAQQQVAGMRRVATALKQAALALQLAARRDWVGLAVRVVDELNRPVQLAQYDEIARSLAFIRVLLSMYQATSVDEAKAIFAASLEDESSRERRYGVSTVDVAALFGARGGYQSSRTYGAAPGTTEGWLYGLNAPLGVQVAWPGFGILIYPLDLGAYLTAAPDAATAGPKWHEALRLGTSLYARPWAAYPVVFGVGADVSPRLESRVDRRIYLTASLELPLFIIH